MKLTVLLKQSRSLWTCLVFVGAISFASCQSQPEINVVGKVAADSTAHNSLEDDPPVKPSGPGGGP